MKSIKSVFKVGNGPSSSHTVGPYRAAGYFGKLCPDADAYRVTLFGSLAHTGEGHSTKKAICAALADAEVLFNKTVTDLPHPNTMLFEAIKDGNVIESRRIFSIGGGSIRVEGETSGEELDVYPQKNFSEIADICKRDGISLVEFIRRMEDDTLYPYLADVWKAMQRTVENGLVADGTLPGGLHLQRKAKLLYNKR